MIRFDHERLYFAQSFDDHFCRITEIGDETKAARSRVDSEPKRIDSVMRYRECSHSDITDRKLGTCHKDSPVAVSLERTITSNRFRRQRVGIDRHVKFSAENFKPADVVRVFVSQKHAIKLLRRNTALLEAQNQLSCAQPAIDQNLAMISGDYSAVSRATAAEHRQAEHGS